jgi:trehalose-phosphatase
MLLSHAKERLVEMQLDFQAEFKPGGIAVHWRGLPENEIRRIQASLLEGWALIARDPRLKLLDFDGGLELRVARPTKGDAVTAVLEEAGLETEVAFLGDDLTDEDAFAVLAGRGLTVLVRPEYRNTKADFWLRPPLELIDFLARWRDAVQ